MTDKISPDARSENMRRIPSKGTKPEMQVRQLIHSLGFHYRLHQKDLPGKPDIVFRRLKKVIFVHGCFWHMHKRCREGHIPQSRTEYWEPKLMRNVERDREHLRRLRKLGWKVLIVWECEVEIMNTIERKLLRFLQS